MSPEPPFDFQSPEAAYTVFYALFVLNMVPSVGWMIWRARAMGSGAPVGALLGGLAVGLVFPPIYNALTLVWFPSNIPLPFITAFGMEDPLFDALGYALFIGFGGWLLCEQLQKGRGPRAVYEAFVLWGVADLVLEIPFLQWGLYTYFGDQPLLIGGFPLHWVFLNGLVPVISGALMYAAVERWPFDGPSVGWRVALCPALAGGLLCIPMAPVATALHADVASGVRIGAALVCATLCFTTLRWIAGRFATADRTARAARATPATT